MIVSLLLKFFVTTRPRASMSAYKEEMSLPQNDALWCSKTGKQALWTNQVRLRHSNRENSHKLLGFSPCGVSLGRHCSLDCSQQRLQFIRIIVAYPIDEEGRCAIHSTAYTTQEILAHTIRICVLSHLALERLLIKMERDSILD